MRRIVIRIKLLLNSVLSSTFLVETLFCHTFSRISIDTTVVV